MFFPVASGTQVVVPRRSRVVKGSPISTYKGQNSFTAVLYSSTGGVGELFVTSTLSTGSRGGQNVQLRRGHFKGMRIRRTARGGFVRVVREAEAETPTPEKKRRPVTHVGSRCEARTECVGAVLRAGWAPCPRLFKEDHFKSDIHRIGGPSLVPPILSTDHV